MVVGELLRRSRINCYIKNVVILDINSLSRPIRIVAIHRSTGQTRVLEELQLCVVEITSMTTDFNASINEWSSGLLHKKCRSFKELIEKKNLRNIPSTMYSSKFSNTSIDLSFTNIRKVGGETLKTGTGDHWLILITCQNVGFDNNTKFPHVH